MKLGMPILYEFMSIEENVKLAKELNLDFVELNLNFPYCRKDIENHKVQELIKKYDIEFTLHFYDEADFGSYREIVDAYIYLLKRYMNILKDDIKLVNFHNNPGPVVTISGKKNYIYKNEYDEYIKRNIQNFKLAKEVLDDYKVLMTIENVDFKNSDFLVNNYSYYKKEGFKFNYDIGHDYLNNDILYDFALNNKNDFLEFHFHDATKDMCHLSLKNGEMDLKKYKNLISDGLRYVVIEVKSSKDLTKSIPIFNEL